VDRLFLDANVLFSAAYRADAGVARLWGLDSTVLLTSDYAVAEARRNLADEDQRERLDRLLRDLEVTSGGSIGPEDSEGIELPEKDWPIIGGAMAARATHLITGDVRHFGPHFGQKISGVLVMPPAQYLRSAR
jgi:predicted nucleic acid-binding protein